jgi:hypothetical protein
MEGRPAARTITVTKLDAARRQLDAAIGLWFVEADPIPIHTLASASHETIHNLYRKKRLKRLLIGGDILNAMQKQQWSELVKRHYNFFRHANRDAQASIEFNPNTNEFIFFFSLIGLKRMKISLTMIESAFLFWFFVNKPSFRQEDSHDDANIESLDELRGISKHEFLLKYSGSWSLFRG